MGNSNLSEGQLDILYACRDAGGPENVEVLQKEDVQKTKKLLAAALSASKGMDADRAENIPLGVLADQLFDDVQSGNTSIDDLDLTDRSQHPESGGYDESDRDAASNPFDSGDAPDLDDALEAASTTDKRLAIEKLAKARAVENRLPKHAAELRSEAADALGYDADPDAIADEALEYGVPADPRSVDSLAL